VSPRQTSTHVDSAGALGARLLEARRRAGLTQQQLSFSGCSTGYISRLEQGGRVPSLQVVFELARRLDVSPQWLSRGVDEAPPEAAERDDLLAEAELALRLDDCDRARELYAALLADPKTAVQARAEAGLGQLAFRENDAEGAIARLTRAYELDTSLDDPAAADTLGRAYARMGAEQEAAAIFRRELELAEQRHDTVNRARFAVLLANALIDATQFSEAATLLSNVLADMPGDSHPLTLARVLWSQSRLHAHKGNTALARRHARQALALLEATEHTTYTARACMALAHIELDAGHPDEAVRLIDRGRFLLGSSGTRYDRAVFALEEARALTQLGLHERATALAMESTAGFVDAHPVDVGRSYAELAAALDHRDDPDRALEIYELAIEFHEKRPSRFLSDTYTSYAQLLERTGRLEQAFAAYKRAATLQAELARA
jgi:tetratricopeptide (TPR) repeat protein